MQVLSIKETLQHPKLSSVFQSLNIQEHCVNSIRKANSFLKSACQKGEAPDVIITEFFYAYGTNYASNHVSNLDMLFVTLQKYDCKAKVVTFVHKHEKQYINKLTDLYTLDQYFVYPAKTEKIDSYFQQLL